VKCVEKRSFYSKAGEIHLGDMRRGSILHVRTLFASFMKKVFCGVIGSPASRLSAIAIPYAFAGKYSTIVFAFIVAAITDATIMFNDPLALLLDHLAVIDSNLV
jgi:hypothetical protein